MTHLSDETLNEYLDGTLASPERDAADGHLAGCVDCRARLGELNGLFAALADLPDVALERDISEAVRAALKGRVVVPRGMRLALLAQGLALPVILALAWPLLKVETALAGFSAPLSLPSFSAADLAGRFAALAAFSLPAFKLSFSLGLDPPAIWITLTLVSAGLLWLVGNALLLRPRAGFKQRRHS